MRLERFEPELPSRGLAECHGSCWGLGGPRLNRGGKGGGDGVATDGDLQSVAGRDFPARVCGEIAEMLCDGAPGVAAVARKLAMSGRSLQRRLADHGTSFRELLQRIRFELAEEYLAGSDLRVSEIAGLLGYSEANSFTNAFRAEKGLSPTQWRKRHPGPA